MKKAPLFILLLASPWFAFSQVVINEVCAANGDVNYDPDFYNFSGWIELYNSSTGSINVGGYYLSDKTDDPYKWRIPANTSIPAKGFRLIWCDKKNTKFHASFSLDSDGEDVILSSSSKQKIDQVSIPEQYTNISYGRETDGSTTWRYCSKPTPAASNISTEATRRLEKPDVALKSGRYSGTQTTIIFHPVDSVRIHYTLDGSEPTENSATYNNTVTLSSTATLKVKAFHDDYLPSKTEVKTFFINEHQFTLPVVSISTDPSFLWDEKIGIYTDGTNGALGNCQAEPKNWNQDWSRHADFAYFKKSGDEDFDQSVDIRIGGACSRAATQKSFVIRARDKYGRKTIDEPLFRTKNIDHYGSFFLRNSGNDFNVTEFRDAIMQRLVSDQMDIDYLAYQPATFYLNGQYWGIQNLREKIDADYFKSNYGIDEDDLDLLQFGGEVLEGTADAYGIYLDSLQKIDLTNSASFSFIDRHIDVQEYINYLVTEIYYGNTDWPGNNIKFWRQRSTNGKFRWVLWDLDFGFELYSYWSYATHPTLDFATDPDNSDWPNPSWSTLHIRLLLQNPVFRTRFIQTMTTAMGSTFKPERVVAMIDNFSNVIKSEMPYHKARWGGHINDWNYEVQRLRDFASARNDYMKIHVADFFGLNETVNFLVSASPVGSFKLNGVTSTESVGMTYYKGIPYKLEPAVTDGMIFKDWKITTRESSSVSMISKGDTWKYFDQGAAPGINWQASAFDDSGWASGAAQLGYGDGDEQTSVSFGADANNKYITTYFRKQFDANNLQALDNLSASVLFDDGIIIYINGTEVFRNGMPAGTTSYNTYANQVMETNNYASFTIDKGLLTEGVNTIAVEVHQVSPNSSDISFDMELKTFSFGNEETTIITDAIVYDTAFTDVIAVAEFEPVLPISGIVINEFCAAQSTVKDDFNETEDWIELYNASDETIDLSGLYLTDDLSNKLKHRLATGDTRLILAPGEYIVLWADEEISQGALHLNFKLSADGEEIGIYQALNGDINTLDELAYAKQQDNVSFSRIPNVTGEFIKTAKVTPRSENIYELVTGVDEIQQGLSVYPIPSDDYIFIKSTIPVDAATVYDTFGRTMKQLSGKNLEEPIWIRDLTPGLYILRVRTGKKEMLVKFIRGCD